MPKKGQLIQIRYNPKPRKGWTPDISGEVFGLVKVRKYLGRSAKGNVWECVCVCGNVVVATTGMLKEGKGNSCGCDYVNPAQKHSMDGSRIYRIWCAMKTRCTNPNVKCYMDYGGRGISVCDRWMNSFQDFYEDMRDGYADNLQIDRINVNGDYNPENCRWATDSQQRRNKRNNKWFEVGGVKMIKTDWAKRIGITYQKLNYYLKTGRTIEDVILKFKP